MRPMCGSDRSWSEVLKRRAGLERHDQTQHACGSNEMFDGVTTDAQGSVDRGIEKLKYLGNGIDAGHGPDDPSSGEHGGEEREHKRN